MRSVYVYTYVHKETEISSLGASRVYIVVGYTFLGARPTPARRSGDVLFDGVSKREILTEQLSPAEIMWADGWCEIRLPWNFRRTRYCSEREGGREGRWREKATETRREGEDRRQVTQGIYQANFTIPDTMVPRRHWPCLTAVSPLPVVTSSGYLCICIGEHIGGNSTRCVLVCRLGLSHGISQVINEAAAKPAKFLPVIVTPVNVFRQRRSLGRFLDEPIVSREKQKKIVSRCETREERLLLSRSLLPSQPSLS